MTAAPADCVSEFAELGSEYRKTLERMYGEQLCQLRGEYFHAKRGGGAAASQVDGLEIDPSLEDATVIENVSRACEQRDKRDAAHVIQALFAGSLSPGVQVKPITSSDLSYDVGILTFFETASDDPLDLPNAVEMFRSGTQEAMDDTDDDFDEQMEGNTDEETEDEADDVVEDGANRETYRVRGGSHACESDEADEAETSEDVDFYIEEDDRLVDIKREDMLFS